ncbi:MAG TPA: hydrolase [Bacteroides sp.]|nr:hydrolase [Bacteroides sp.]
MISKPVQIHAIRLLAFIGLLVPGHVISSGQETSVTDRLKYYNAEEFVLEGSLVPREQKARYYDRLPLHSKEKVHPHVWYLSRTSAGLAVRFRTNSSVMGVKWEILRDEQRNHMAETGIKGLDLYCRVGDEWMYVNTAKPDGRESTYMLINDASDSLRDFRIYLPLYDGLERLEIGIEQDAVIEKPRQEWSMKPIVFYGTSITQGGCASRPGMAYSNIISRKLNVECINLGFAGNGRMEPGVNAAMADMDASLYVIDCVGNMTVEQIHQYMAPLVDTLRRKKPLTPIVFVECLMHNRTWFNDSLRNSVIEKNKALKEEYVALHDANKEEIYYIGVRDATGEDREGTVDGVHLTDLGFLRFSEHLIGEFRKLGLVK